MRDLLRQTSEKEMSANMLSALYDIDMLYKVKYISPLQMESLVLEQVCSLEHAFFFFNFTRLQLAA